MVGSLVKFDATVNILFNILVHILVGEYIFGKCTQHSDKFFTPNTFISARVT